jgi:hypothetical protein
MQTKLLYKSTILLFFLIISTKLFSQLGISATPGYTPSISSMLDISSTTKGFLMPRMNTTQRITLTATATDGLTVYDTDTKSFWYYNSNTASWVALAAGNQWLSTGNDVSNMNTGNVGIGLTNPTGRLQINGSGGGISNNSDINPHIKLKLLNDGNWGWIRFESNLGTRSFSQRYDFFGSTVEFHNYSIFYNTTQLFTINGEGKVKIGTGIAAYSLDVTGDINLTGKLRVAANEGIAGNVLKKDATNNMVWQAPSVGFSAKGVAPAISNFQDVPTGINLGTVVTLLTSEESDASNLFNGERFTVPENGMYHIDVHLQLSEADAGLHALSIGQFNSAGTSQVGTIRVSNLNTSENNGDKNLSISADVQLFTTNTYKIIYQHNAAGSQRITGSFYSWINLHRIY